MTKDFEKWHKIKSEIDSSESHHLFRAQEIWWCSLGANVGVEADGKQDCFERPILVFRKFNSEMFWGIPLTSHIKELKPFHFSFMLHSEERIAVLSQLRVLSSKRLIRRFGKLSDKQFELVSEAVIKFINETDPFRGPRVPNGNNICS